SPLYDTAAKGVGVTQGPSAEMNHVKSALLSGHRPHRLAAAAPQQLAATASFHSTPPLQRKRKTQWQHRFNFYAKRRRNRDTKRTMIRNMSEYAEQLFNSWRDEDEKKDASSGPSWFRGHRWVRDSRNNGFRSHEFYYDTVKSRGGFEFCTSDDDDEPETVFRNAFRGNQHTYYWSFESDDFPRRNSRRSHSESSGHWSYETDDEGEISTQTEVSVARKALGLSTSGPLKLEDVKSAYRTCALRWHPDRHHGSSKATAEEKFKRCSAAYQTLCDSLATA
uniref:J domain-containing protein n=3 Tax=Aegilops tauschii subsp. strangulata TaxID=200361 RepID=A0A452Z2I9_AEGTS